MLECLDNIIGITRTDCACEIGTMSTEEKGVLNTSQSGVFVDEIAERFPNWAVFKDAFSCSNLYNTIIAKLAAAKIFVHTEVINQFNKKMKPSLSPFLGTIGETSFAGYQGQNNKYRGIKIYNGVTSGVMSIHSIRLNVNVTGQPITVKLISKTIGTPYTVAKEWSTTTTSGFTVITQTEEKLPLYKGNMPIEYFLVYQINAAEVNNKIDCGCASATLYKQYAGVRGVAMDSLSDIETTTYTTDETAHGLSLELGFRCESGQMICRNFDVDNDSSRSLAIAYALKFAKLMIDETISTSKINGATMIDRGELDILSNLYEVQYRQYMQFAIQEIDFNSNACFFCNSATISMGNISLTGAHNHRGIETYAGGHHATMAMPLNGKMY